MPSLTTTGPVLLSTGLRPGPVQSLAPYASGPVVVAVPGPPGSAIRAGSGAPVDDGIMPGDPWVDTDTGDLWEWSTAWALVGSILGPQGPTGATGPQGDAGPAGATGATGAQGETGPQGPTGAQGADGAPGADGADGAPGVGVPTGGTTGQTLIKTSGTDYDTEWAAPAGGASAGEVRHDWAAPHSYMASAPAGTAESATGWRITRITVADAGTATVAVCLDGAWTARESEVYA